MTITKKSLIVSAIVATLGAGGLGIATTFAATNVVAPHGRVDNLITAIAEKFHLNTTDVKAVFDEQRSMMKEQRQEQRQENIADRIAQAVKSGILTQTQADAVLARLPEQQAFLESLKGKTPEERKTALKENMDELKVWAKANGIPEQLLRFAQPVPHGSMHREMMHRR